MRYEVREIEHEWIRLADGTRLAARIWLPRGAENEPVPGILEYIPYRKRDFTAVRDAMNHPYMAARGYACVRVDLRGSGDSEGLLTDEYLQVELEDGCEVLRWIAAQPWCDGRVGMIGIAWGGFNGLGIAALRPPELKAVVSVCSTDDRYSDDVHHMGGCLLGENLSWSAVMFSYNSLPPDPALVGERWRTMWFERLEASWPWLDTWLRHQRRDAYWKHGSICEDYAAVECPVMAVSGWADGYSNAVFRLVENLRCPRIGLIGPWSHAYPHIATPGPAIGFLQEAVRWWDYWLKGIDNGIMDEPVLRVWMQDSVPPTTSYLERPGRWVAEDVWPSTNVEQHVYTLELRTLTPHGGAPPRPLTLQSPLTVGLFAGKWCSYPTGPDLAHDQRQEDGGALVFDTAPLETRLDVMGAPVLELELASDRPLAMIAARLSDVRPDGKATRVTYGLLNLTHRNGNEHPELLTPDSRYRVRLKLNDVAQVFPAGHRLRLSISTSYWPLAWPPPEPTRLTILTGSSTLTVPQRHPRAEDEQLREFPAPETAPLPAHTVVESEHHNWLVHRDLASDTSTLEVVNDYGVYRLDDIDLTIRRSRTERYTSHADDFESVRGETQAVRELSRGDWHVKTVTRIELTSTTTTFRVHADIDAYEGSTRVFCRSGHTEIPRDFT